jgi:hypothetical protein
MSKGIRSYPESERKAVIRRRISNTEAEGLGYLSAKDAQKKLEEKK